MRDRIRHLQGVEPRAQHQRGLIDQHVSGCAQFARKTGAAQNFRLRIGPPVTKGRKLQDDHRQIVEMFQKRLDLLARRDQDADAAVGGTAAFLIETEPGGKRDNDRWRTARRFEIIGQNIFVRAEAVAGPEFRFLCVAHFLSAAPKLFRLSARPERWMPHSVFSDPAQRPAR